MQTFHQQIRAFALELQASLNRRDPAFFNVHFDYAGNAALMQSAIDKHPAGRLVKRKFRKLYQPGWLDFGDKLVNRLEAGSAFRFLGHVRDRGQDRLVFRLMDEHMNLDYFEMTIRKGEEDFQIVDVLDFRKGEPFGVIYPMLLRMQLNAAGFRNRWAQKLGLEKFDYLRHQEFWQLKNEGEFTRALDVWENLSQDLKSQKFYKIQKLQVCAYLPSDAFLRAVEEFCDAFLPDGCFFLAAVDGYRNNRMYGTALDCIDRLDEFVGGDAAINYHRGCLHNWMDHREEAAAYSQLFACMEPSFEAGYELLADVLPEWGMEKALA